MIQDNSFYNHARAAYFYLFCLVLLTAIGCQQQPSPSTSANETLPAPSAQPVAENAEHTQSVAENSEHTQPVVETASPTAVVTETIITLPGAWGHINFDCLYYLPDRIGRKGLSDYQWLADSETVIMTMSVSSTIASKLYRINLAPEKLPLSLLSPQLSQIEYSPAPAQQDGSKFAYISGLATDAPIYRFYDVQGTFNIYVVDGHTQQVVKSYASQNEIPIEVKWSWDDSKLAVRVLTEDKIKLEIIDLSSLESYTLVDSIHVRSFEWHPSEDLIAVEESEIASVIDSGSVFDIYIVDVASGQMEKVTQGKQCESGVDWSPDGKRILYTDAFETSSDIFMLDLATKDVKNLTRSRASHELWPTWSPDGQQIAYIHQEDRQSLTDLCLLRVSDGTVSCLTNTPKSEFENLPRWSPDGRWLVYEVTKDSPYALSYSLAIIEATGSDPVPIAVWR